MRPSIRKSFALMVAGLGLSATVALAGPKHAARTDPPAKHDPKPPAGLPKADPKPFPRPTPMPLPTVPKVDPKPVLPTLPKADPRPVVPTIPRADPVKPPIVLPRVDSKPAVKPVFPEARPPAKPIDTIKPPLPKVEAKLPTVPGNRPEVKLPTTPVVRTPIVHERPKAGGPVEMPKGPGLRLAAGTKVDPAELARIKPPVDLTRTKPEAVLAAKPPATFRAKPIKLDSIHVPKDAPAVDRLGIGSVKHLTVNQAFVVNKHYYTGGDYHLKFGTKTAFGYCYPGKWHTHWHHCIWDPCFSCYYFYCPSTSCYYYWCETDYCYYPCYWFVEYQTVCYPWWICGGFGGYGYVAKPSFGIFIGW